jgi:hypothetical protein
MGAFRWLVLLFSIWLTCGSAQAERRVALVIGNSAYKSVPRLANPVNDAVLVGGMFKNAGFDSTDIRTDLNAAEMRKALREFSARARDAEVAVIYYAGHGIELDGANYLIPTDAALETDGDVLDETVALDRALFAVEPAKQLRLVILDACRDNPFARTMKRTVAARAIGRGLAAPAIASTTTTNARRRRTRGRPPRATMRPSGMRSERRSNPRPQHLRHRARSYAAGPDAGRWREDADLNGPAQRPDREAWAPRMSATAWVDWLRFAGSKPVISRRR